MGKMTSSANDKKTLRQRLVQERLHLPDRLERIARLQQVMRMWLMDRPDTVIGAYWPIKGEFDPLPALYRWQEDAVLGSSIHPPGNASAQQTLNLLNKPDSQRRIGLPVVNKEHKTLIFYSWYPGCPM